MKPAPGLGMALRATVAVAVALGLSVGCTGEEVFAPGGTTPCERNSRDIRLAAVWAPAWSPDGRQVAFESGRSPEGRLSPGIYITDVGTGATRKVYDEQYLGGIQSMSWSPTGSYLLVSRGLAIYTFELTTRTMYLLNAPQETMRGGAWSPEGDSIYYTRETTTLTGNHLYVTSLAGGVGRQFVPSDGAELFPVGPVDFSPGGEWITFAGPAREMDGSFRPGGEIFIVRRDGTGYRQVTNLRGFNAHPKWIDGGRAILFDHLSEECYYIHNRPGHSWVVEPETGVIYQLPKDVGDRRVQFCYPPAIDRTGKRAAAIWLDRDSPYGVLWLMSTRGDSRRILYAPKYPYPSN